MDRQEKERQVAELTERLRTSETLIVADYRGLTMPQIDQLRSKLLEQGARFTVVKNTLTSKARRSPPRTSPSSQSCRRRRCCARRSSAPLPRR